MLIKFHAVVWLLGATFWKRLRTSSARITRTLPGKGALPTRTCAAARRIAGQAEGASRSAMENSPCGTSTVASTVASPHARWATEEESSAARAMMLARIRTGFMDWPLPSLASQAVDVLQHLIGGVDHARVGFIGALRHDHLHEFVDHADIGLLEHALHDRAQAFAAARGSDHGIARRGGGEKQVAAGRVQASGVVEECDLQGSDLLRRSLASRCDADGPVRCYRHRSCPRRDGHRRLHRVSVLRDQIALRVEMKAACPGVRSLPVGQEHLKKALTLNRQVQRIASL